MKWLDGNKVYIGMLALGIVGILAYAGIIDAGMKELLWTGVAAWSGVAIRSAYKKGK